MENKRPQLNLDELHALKWLLGGVLALLSAATVLYMEVEATFWLILIALAVPVTLRRPALTLRVPGWAHRLAFPLIVAVFAADFYRNKEVLPALIRLAMMLVLYRAVTPRGRRDDLQLIVLGIFLVVVAGVLSVSPVFAVQIVVFTGCALLFLLVINLIASAETGRPAQAGSPDAPQVWMRIGWRRLASRLRAATDWRVFALASGLFAGVVGLSALLFFALPRFEITNTLFLDNLISKKSKTGFSETVRFGDVTDIQRDTDVALSVDVSDIRAIPAERYWRMLVLDVYQKGEFSRSPELAERMRPQKQPAAGIDGGARARAGDAVWTFYLEAGISRYLPLLGSFNRLQFNDGPQSHTVNDELRLVRIEKTPVRMFAYRVEGMRSEPALGEPEILPRRDPEPGLLGETAPGFLALNLSAADTARLAGWVRELAAPPDDAPAFVRLAGDWLRRKHGYALQSELPRGEGDPLVRWMGGDTTGHCELFAGAFTLLARAAGYPSRLVTGFRGGTWNPVSGNLTVRNSDAHAWCEIYDARARQWLRVDPTPGAPAPAAADATLTPEVSLARISDSGWSARFEGLRIFWYRRIVDFDRSSQVELARTAKNAIEARMSTLKAGIMAGLASAGEWLRRPWDAGRVATWGALAAAAVVGMIAWRALGRTAWAWWPGRWTRGGGDPVRREAGRWLLRIGEPPKTGAWGEWAGVREDLRRLRYGAKAGWPSPQATFVRARRAYRDLKAGRGG